MAKKKAVKKKTNKKSYKKHVFLGGNYAFGAEVIQGIGYFQMEQLNKMLPIGAKPKSKDRTGQVETFIFFNPITIDKMIENLEFLKHNVMRIEIRK